MTFAVPAGEYDIELVDLPVAPNGYVYTGPMTDDDNWVEANDAITVTNVLTMEIAEGTGTLTKILQNTGDYVSLASEVYFCNINAGGEDACIAQAVVTAGYGEQGQAVNTVSAEVPAGQYAICTEVTITYANSAILSSGFDCEFGTEDDEGNIVPILVLDGDETVVYNDFDAQVLGSLDIYVRRDIDDTPIADADVCLYDADGELVRCTVTNLEGDAWFAVPRGVYTVNVMAEDFEQESSVITYSPSADAADGEIEDMGLDAEVIVALDGLDF